MNIETTIEHVPAELNLSLHDLHRAVDALRLGDAPAANAPTAFSCGCEGCRGCRGCGCEGCRGCGCEGCRGCRGCRGCH